MQFRFSRLVVLIVGMSLAASACGRYSISSIRSAKAFQDGIVLYQRGDTGMFWPLFRAAMPEEQDDPAGYAAFEETMITSRNKVMVDHAEPILAKGNAFMAVGALHLPGPEGLVEDFRKAGYTVTAVGL